MNTTVTVVIVWHWGPMDLLGSRLIPGRNRRWIQQSQLVSLKDILDKGRLKQSYLTCGARCEFQIVELCWLIKKTREMLRLSH